MPAIQPARLKKDIARLASYFNQPTQFVQHLEAMLEFYADRTRRSSQSGAPSPLLPSYNVPAPVLQQLSQQLLTLTHQSPQSGLALADTLWSREYYEMKWFAVRMISEVRMEVSEPILTRLRAWVKPKEEPSLVDEFFHSAAMALFPSFIEELFPFATDWLNQRDLPMRVLAVRLLEALVETPGFENLPFIFKSAAPLMTDAETIIHPYLLDLFQALALRSPSETAYYIQQNIILSDRSSPRWLVRQVLAMLPEEQQANLRVFL